MTHIIKDVVLTILGGLIAGAVGIWTALWQRRFDAKNEFHIFVSVIKGRMPKEGFAKFHASTRIEVRDAVSRLLPFLKHTEVEPVETACGAYTAIDEDILDDKKEDDDGAAWLVYFGRSIPPKPSNILKLHLDKLYESIK